MKLTTPYNAGILPYTTVNGEILFLLGKDRESKGWSDFGGGKESSDSDYPFLTANRELSEETHNVVAVDTLPTITIKTDSNTPYYMYVCYVDYIDYGVEYENTNPDSNTEKTELKWFTISDMLGINLRNSFENTFNKYGLPIIREIESTLYR